MKKSKFVFYNTLHKKYHIRCFEYIFLNNSHLNYIKDFRYKVSKFKTKVYKLKA